MDNVIAAALEGFTTEQATLALDGFDNLQADGRLERFCGPREQAELIALFERIRSVAQDDPKPWHVTQREQSERIRQASVRGAK